MMSAYLSKITKSNNMTWDFNGERGIAKILLEGVGHILGSDARGRKVETILLEGVGLFLCSDARGRKIEMLEQGWGFGVLWGDVGPSH